MKILSKAKKNDIQAEAKAAFTAGPLDIKAEANVNIAKQNIETNTETAIQVSWSGGGHIMSRELQWDMKSLMEAAARFPDLVAQCPQRTYAILTKYDTLRSFVNVKPAAYTKLQYENAQIYTNAMMDTYMSYKNLCTKLGADIFAVKNKNKVIKAWSDGQIIQDADKQNSSTDVVPRNSKSELKTTPKVIHNTSKVFTASVKRLEDGMKEIRRQMTLIVNEVDLIEKDPKIATDDHIEPYQSVAEFEERLPIVEAPKPPAPKPPLGGKRIMAKTLTADELQKEVENEAAAAEAPPLFSGSGEIAMEEQNSLEVIQNNIQTSAEISVLQRLSTLRIRVLRSTTWISCRKTG
jgi:hypothetical protein